MVRHFLLRPFAEATQQVQYQELCAVLATTDEAPGLLLGNVQLHPRMPPLDAVLIRPHSITVLLLVPRGGHLHIPALRYGAWQLNGQPLPVQGADNLFTWYQQQKPLLTEWLSEQWDMLPASLPPLTALVVFAAPTTFSAQVEQQLRHQAAADDFQLLGNLSQLPRRLRQLPMSGNVLAAELLQNWAPPLTEESQHFRPTPSNATTLADYWQQKAQQLWRWLGADDLPTDPSYSLLPDAAALQQHEQLRRELQAEFRQQQQAQADRETALTHHIAQLHHQLAQATTGPDQSEKAALATALQTARAEAATRHQELDTRIQQLSSLITQLQPAAAVAPARPLVPATTKRVTKAPPLPRLPRQQWHQVVATLLIVGSLAVGTWGMVRLSAPAGVVSKSEPTKTPPMLAASYSPEPTSQLSDTLVADTYADDEELLESNTLDSADSGEDLTPTQPIQMESTDPVETLDPAVEGSVLQEAEPTAPDLPDSDPTLEVPDEPGR